MTRVVAFGVFDGIHPGHVSFLTQARALGDELIVVVTRDVVARAEKGRVPALTEHERREVVQALRVVDGACIGDAPETYGSILRDLAPDIIAVGYDQQYDGEVALHRLADLGLSATQLVRCEAYEGGKHHTSTLRS
ncbi:MAG: adenylyltransferase/cytidyltransferase family protein [bacterium]|nr:adenylyltransferase/cytidyltransferase family protein [bacterium]